MSKYLVIVDYNLARFLDVKLMSDYAKSRYGVESILIRPSPKERDKEIASIIFDLDPRKSAFIEKALSKLAPYKKQILAVLPFSDNSVASGAALAEALNLKADSSNLAEAAYSKITYRKSEQFLKKFLEAQNIFVPKFVTVNKREELEAFSRLCPKGFVLKPSTEGNNRGVIRLDQNSDLKEAFDEVEPYLKDGLICEEFIEFSEEYSFDGLGSLNFITEKLSVEGRYPVEKGQIVPARRSLEILDSIGRAGKAANMIVGQFAGPFHNEIKLDPVTKSAAVVEPNRRPAGMRIWYLAEKVYGVNFFKLWIDSFIGGLTLETLPAPKGVAAILQLATPRHGFLTAEILDPNWVEKFYRKLRQRISLEVEMSHFRFTQQTGGEVFPLPRDNSGFIAEICLFEGDPIADIKKTMFQIEQEFQSLIEDFIFVETRKAV